MAIKRQGNTLPICLSVIRTVFFSFVIFTLCEVIYATANDDQISQQLNTIMARTFEKQSDFALAETDSLKLLEMNRAPSGKGKVYQVIAAMYARNITVYHDKVAKYCELALQNPQDAPDACRLCADWGAALEIQYENNRGSEAFAEVRRKIVKPYLRGFEITLMNRVPETLQPLPAVGMFDYSGSTKDEHYLAIVKKHEDEQKAREEAIGRNALLLCRNNIIDRIAKLYGRSPAGFKELREAALHELHDESAVEDLLRRVENPATSNYLPTR